MRMQSALVSPLGKVALALFATLAFGCAEEPEAKVAHERGGALVTPPSDLVRTGDRCAYAVRKFAAEQFDCEPGELELHPVGPRAFITSGCDRLGTFLCDDAPGGAPRVVRQH